MPADDLRTEYSSQNVYGHVRCMDKITFDTLATSRAQRLMALDTSEEWAIGLPGCCGMRKRL